MDHRQNLTTGVHILSLSFEREKWYMLCSLSFLYYSLIVLTDHHRNFKKAHDLCVRSICFGSHLNRLATRRTLFWMGAFDYHERELDRSTVLLLYLRVNACTSPLSNVVVEPWREERGGVARRDPRRGGAVVDPPPNAPLGRLYTMTKFWAKWAP
jgi:hypothetical protein